MRKQFSGKTYFTFQQCENAIRASNLNRWLDDGHMFLGDDGPDKEGVLHEIDECIEPRANGILCRKKNGEMVTIFAYKKIDQETQS